MEPKLLFIDDEPAHHLIVEHLCRESRMHQKFLFSYQSFVQASDALSYILDNNEVRTLPDLIILDLNMPIISGWGFLNLLEAISPRLEKPVDVIILTSSLNLADREKAADFSCVKGFFVKPFTYALLKDILNSPFISLGKRMDGKS